MADVGHRQVAIDDICNLAANGPIRLNTNAVGGAVERRIRHINTFYAACCSVANRHPLPMLKLTAQDLDIGGAKLWSTALSNP